MIQVSELGRQGQWGVCIPLISHKHAVQFIIDLQCTLKNDFILTSLYQVCHSTLHTVNGSVEFLGRQAEREMRQLAAGVGLTSSNW